MKQIVVIAFLAVGTFTCWCWTQIQASDPKVPNATGSYSIVATNGKTIMIEQQSGKTWILATPAADQQGWVPIPRFEDEKSYQRWLESFADRPKSRDLQGLDLDNAIAEALQKERRLVEVYGEKHPDVIRHREMIEEMLKMFKNSKDLPKDNRDLPKDRWFLPKWNVG